MKKIVILLSVLTSFCLLGNASLNAQGITWTNLVNTSVSGTLLKKTAGLADTADAGANSAQQITSGNGYLEFTASENNKIRYLGLTNTYSGVGYKQINYAFHLTSVATTGGYTVAVRENNIWKAETAYTIGTVLRIAIEGGIVKYYVNGKLLYSSAVNPVYPLVADASFMNLGGAITNAILSTGTTPTPTPTPTPVPTVDTTPPTLSSVGSSGISTSGASITWITNESSDSLVEYGTSTAYGSSKLLTPMLTGHQVDLAGLAANTMYHYRVKSKDASGNTATSGNFTFVTGQNLNTGIRAGRLDDGGIYLPANYNNWTPPARGSQFTDSAFGTTITRLSNGQSQFNQPVHHEYATMSPFNSDNSRVLLLTENSGFYVADRSGNVILTPAQTSLSGSSEPRWSTSNPNILYFHTGNQILKFDISTQQKTTVRTFTQFGAINFGGGESDISEDGDHMVIIGDNTHVGVYTFSTNTLGTTLNISAAGGFDYFDMTANNNVIVRWGSEGTGRYQGFELFDGNMRFIRQVIPYLAHGDRGRDTNGDEVLILLGSRDPSPPAGCQNNGVEKVRLSDSRKTCLLAVDWYAEVHISANSNGSNPWIIVSQTDGRDGTVNSTSTLPGDWQSRWKPRYNELVMVKIDGTEVRRLAHHRTRLPDDYWYSPRTAISRDGTYAVFDSNFGFKPMAYYTDTFLLHLINGQ